MSYQFTARQLTERDKQEAETIARKLFGCYNWQGVRQDVEGKPGLAQYINRVIIRQIKPQGANWLVGEHQYTDEDGFPRFEPGFGFVKSTYYIKRL